MPVPEDPLQNHSQPQKAPSDAHQKKRIQPTENERSGEELVQRVSNTQNVWTDWTGERSLCVEPKQVAVEEACADLSQGSEDKCEYQRSLTRLHTLHGTPEE